MTAREREREKKGRFSRTVKKKGWKGGGGGAPLSTIFFPLENEGERISEGVKIAYAEKEERKEILRKPRECN